MAAFAATFDDVARRRRGLRGVAHRTPVAHVGARSTSGPARACFAKAENLQRMGAFKFRGAYNRLAQLDGRERAARRRRVFERQSRARRRARGADCSASPATIVMPADAPAAKLAATRGYGAEVVLYDRCDEESRRDRARRSPPSAARSLVPPFDDPAIIAGQGTAALELIEDVGPLDVLLVLLGGGGLLAG